MSLVTESTLPALDQLPTTYAIQLTDFSAISLIGAEQSKYLQGQVTCDVNTANENSLIHGAHCDAKGKVFSSFRLINRNNAHLLLQPKSSIDASLAELKKFGVFAKVEIAEVNDLSFYALVGKESSTLLQQHFTRVPDSLTPVIQIENTTLVYIAGSVERYILIDDSNKLEGIINKLSLPIYTTKIWQLLEICNGFPNISNNTVSEYVPQQINMQAINGISFTKGCYLGQETVARMQYLGKNKRALYYLTGTNTSLMNIDESIEKQLGENWRRGGDILMSYQADNGSLYVQAVLASDIDEQTALRLKIQPETELSVCVLPYILT